MAQHGARPIPASSSSIKALSDKDVKELLEGAGMGFAKAAAHALRVRVVELKRELDSLVASKP